MIVAYGDGVFVQGPDRLAGKIILGEHKLYLQRDGEDLVETFIPLEKIERIRLQGRELSIHVKPSLTLAYWAAISGEAGNINDLAEELIARRGLTKKFLRREWVDTAFHDI